MRSDRERLLDILEAIERIERYQARGEAAFNDDELVQTWMVRQVEIIGEASSKLSEALKQENADVPWKQIARMRNIIVHGYFVVRLDTVWQVIKTDVPALKQAVNAMLAKLAN